MARKNRLEPSNEQVNAIIGIVTLHRDYQLVHFINKSLEINLVNKDDLPIYSTKSESLSYYPFYIFHHPDLRTDFCLIANHNGITALIPSLKQINYLLLLQGAAYKQHIDSYINNIRKIKRIQAAIPIIQTGVKEMGSLLEDLEMHKIDLQKKEEEKKDLLFRRDEE
jgi:hypothetical protein